MPPESTVTLIGSNRTKKESKLGDLKRQGCPRPLAVDAPRAEDSIGANPSAMSLLAQPRGGDTLPSRMERGIPH